MRYFCLHPLKPQYFFPKNFTRHKVFLSFYQPYSLLGRISWWLFRHVSFVRWLLGKKNVESFIPEKEIRDLTRSSAPMAFNTGTPGPEQKITALGFENNEYFFLKYARTPLAASNVTNEYHTLRQLEQLDIVPRVLDFKMHNGKVLLKTSVLQGTRTEHSALNEAIIAILHQLADLSVKDANRVNTNLLTCFAHGDFCPWNMMTKDGKIFFYDWEMAGNYPLGYDLYTYIFQTSFLLSPEKSPAEIISMNHDIIHSYFAQFKIDNWLQYLSEFARLKVEFESQKGENGLTNKYRVLYQYARKA